MRNYAVIISLIEYQQSFGEFVRITISASIFFFIKPHIGEFLIVYYESLFRNSRSRIRSFEERVGWFVELINEKVRHLFNLELLDCYVCIEFVGDDGFGFTGGDEETRKETISSCWVFGYPLLERIYITPRGQHGKLEPGLLLSPRIPLI